MAPRTAREPVGPIFLEGNLRFIVKEFSPPTYWNEYDLPNLSNPHTQIHVIRDLHLVAEGGLEPPTPGL